MMRGHVGHVRQHGTTAIPAVEQSQDEECSMWDRYQENPDGREVEKTTATEGHIKISTEHPALFNISIK